MPTYDYQCQKCGFEFERQQRITEDAIKTCPKCKARKAKRLLSAPNFILKGGGWYADGYGSAGSSSKPSGGDDSSSSTSSDSADASSKSDSASSKDTPPTTPTKPTKKTGDKKSSKPSGKSAA